MLAKAAFFSAHLVHLILDLGSLLPHLLGELLVLLELFIIHVELLLLNLVGSVRELLNLLSSKSVDHCILINKDPIERHLNFWLQSLILVLLGNSLWLRRAHLFNY